MNNSAYGNWPGSQYIQPPVPQFQTNKLFCVSLQDALARPVDFNTSIVYFNQNNNEVYEVNTDINGYKTYQVGEVTIKETSAPQGYVSKIEYDNLKKQLADLENKLNQQGGTVNNG